tara:strand:- start:1104 stop:2498 length:1395 start_codon:yes stop_codon:yes gene_type:complete
MKKNNELNQPKVQNLVIIGSGPAGFTAAIYAARAKLRPLLITGFEKGGIPGGQLMTTTHVENYPGFPDGVLGPELMDLMKAQAIRWGTELIEADAERVNLGIQPFEVEAEKKLIKTNSLIIATGASANRLNLPGENLLWSKGISACAICDGATPQLRGEELAVVGGGDSACEEAVYLTKFGSHVHLIVRSKKLRASGSMADRVLANSQISIHWNSEVIKAEGDDWLTSINVLDRETSKTNQLKIKGLFYAIGHTPNTDLFKEQLDLAESEYIKTALGRPETSVEGVFAAGDVSDSEWRQGITAAGSGCKAALAAERWLTAKNLAVIIESNQLEPERAKMPLKIETTTEKNYSANSLWQKGNYPLRRLYHESNRPILVIYTSPECGPCHVLKPQLRRILEDFKGEVQGVEIDIEADTQIARQALIKGTPTVQLFLNKELKKEWRGVKQRSEFKDFINNIIETKTR